MFLNDKIKVAIDLFFINISLVIYGGKFEQS